MSDALYTWGPLHVYPNADGNGHKVCFDAGPENARFVASENPKTAQAYTEDVHLNAAEKVCEFRGGWVGDIAGEAQRYVQVFRLGPAGTR